MQRLGVIAGAVALWLVVAADGEGQAPKPIRGFSSAAAAAELAIEARLASRVSPDSTGSHFRFYTARPHPAGSARNKLLAEDWADRLRRYGWEDVRLHRYDVLLPWPRRVAVSMVAPRSYRLSLKEDPYPIDHDAAVDVGPTYLGMSASGDVTGDLIYASSGNPADYDWLEARGIDLEGKIALVRYSNPYSYRGFKALTAERRGLAALLIYSDPQEDGYRRGLTFPDGPWGPESHLQRGAITYDFMVAGDPLTPGWASVEGARRIPEAEARSIPRIIMVPISYRDATPLLRSLGGPVAPPAWQGALPFTYRVGPGAARVRVTVDMDGKTRPIWVAEGRLRGSESPEELVVLGNHRDAWVYGAVDPSSGTATQLELARVLGQLKAEGHRPRRTIVMASWDAEEWHLTGSTEWGEQFARDLSANAVAYLNVDGSTSGHRFGASAVASLDPLIVETARDVLDPATRRPLLDVWADDNPRADGDPLDLVTNTLGSGSDYTVFLNFLGVPIVDLAFDGPYGVYHSRYDTYTWMSRFGDPGFRYMTAMAEVWGRMALRLANAEVLPYDFLGYADRVGRMLLDLQSSGEVTKRLDLGPAQRQVARWREAAWRLADLYPRATAAAPAVRAELNRTLLGVEREWLLPDGIPGRPWFKHALYAPKYTYAAMSVPGVQEAVDQGDWARAEAQLGLVTERIRRVADRVAQAAAIAAGNH